MVTMSRLLLAVLVIAACVRSAGSQVQWNAAAIEAETMQHFQALLRLDTSSPPGNEIRAVEYLEQVLKREGIPYQVFAKDPNARTWSRESKATGRSGLSSSWGTPTSSRWTRRSGPSRHSAPTRDGGYVYGRGAVDDKDSVAAGLMLMLILKRTGVALDRDVDLHGRGRRGRGARVRRPVHDRQSLRRH